jgi:hypothetical protein
MNKIFLSVVGVCIVLCVVAVAPATSLLADTPLYTVRMEQNSSEKHFLPTEVNEFSYNAEPGYTVTKEVSAYTGGATLDTGVWTCEPNTHEFTCKTCNTCLTCESCFHCETQDTCEPTCETCTNTCESTCHATCPDTCANPTCPETCPNTCTDC